MHDKSPASMGNEIESTESKILGIGSSMRALLEHTPLSRSEEVGEAVAAVVAGLTAEAPYPSSIKKGWEEYAKIIEAIVSSIENTVANPRAYEKAQISAIIHKALIFLSAGNTARYVSELDDADVYAFNAGLDHLSEIISGEIAAVLQKIDFEPSTDILAVKLRGVISDENREYLRDCLREGDDLEEMLGLAYAVLLEEGMDPDEELRKLGIID